MTIDEILVSIDKLNSKDRKKVIEIIKEKYNLTNKLPEDAFVVGKNYNFSNEQEDDIYDNMKRK